MPLDIYLPQLRCEDVRYPRSDGAGCEVTPDTAEEFAIDDDGEVRVTDEHVIGLEPEIFGEKVYVSFSEHLGKYRKGQVPARSYNGLLSMYVGTSIYKDFRKKTLEQNVPRAFAELCIDAAYKAKARVDAREALAETRACYAEKQASVAAENERRKEFNREIERYEEAVRLSEAYERAERLRRYADALEAASDADQASWVREKADWADPVTHAADGVFGNEHTVDGSAPEKQPQIPYNTKGIEADAFFMEPVGEPSPTLEAYREVLRKSRKLDGTL